MTSKEALEIIGNIDIDGRYPHPNYLKDRHKKEYDIVMEVAERDTPKKPLKVNNTPFIYWCPECDCSSIQRYDKHCRDCGQKLDWSE